MPVVKLTHSPGRMSGHRGRPAKTVRRARFAYEDTHDWAEDDSLDYDFLQTKQDQEEELPLLQKMMRNWQIVFVRGAFLLSFLILLMMVICCCCGVLCRVCCQSLRDNCVPCKGFLDILTSCYQDPTYKRAKQMAEMMGLKLDYATYCKVKDRFERQGSEAFNPLGLPRIQ